jgi:uncharacterized protein (DUF2267 family)
MSFTGLDVFDATVNKTNAWLNELMETLAIEDRHAAYLALRSTLHVLRDRLTVEEAAHLAAQLPMLIRGFYYEGWDPTDVPLPVRDVFEFLVLIDVEHGATLELDAEEVARAVFKVLERRVSAGEIEDVKQLLPKQIRQLWGTAEALTH